MGKAGRAVNGDGALKDLLSKVQGVVDAADVKAIDRFSVGMVQALVQADEEAMRGRVHKYQRAVLRGQEKITSTGDGRSSVKDSAYVLVRFPVGDRDDVPFVARVR